ncbi:MAG: hypothetical protein ACOC7V_16770, partial [Spirochaetota bacterium]
MNRSAFHKRLVRAISAVVLTISAIGCATAPDTSQTPPPSPAEVRPESPGHLPAEPLPETPDLSLRTPV